MYKKIFSLVVILLISPKLAGMEESFSKLSLPNHCVIIIILNEHKKEEDTTESNEAFKTCLYEEVNNYNNSNTASHIYLNTFKIKENCSQKTSSKNLITEAYELFKKILALKTYPFTPVHLVILDKTSLDIVSIASQMLNKTRTKLSFKEKEKKNKKKLKLKKEFKNLLQATDPSLENMSQEKMSPLAKEIEKWKKKAKKRTALSHTCSSQQKFKPSKPFLFNQCKILKKACENTENETMADLHIINQSSQSKKPSYSGTIAVDEVTMGIIHHYVESPHSAILVKEIEGNETFNSIPAITASDPSVKQACFPDCIKKPKILSINRNNQDFSTQVTSLIIYKASQTTPFS